MALPDFAKYTTGTPKVWAASGGDYAITLTSLANGSSRQGVKGDLGEYRARLWEVLFASAVASAATAGTEIELYWAASTSSTAGTDNPGNTTGADAALASPDEYKQQLIFVGSLVLSNAAGTGVQRTRMVFEPSTRYGMPVVVNKSGVALSGTAGNHAVTLNPVEEPATDTVSG